MSVATVEAPAPTKTRRTRKRQSGICPSCGDGVNLSGSSQKCEGCGLVAPPSAFTVQGGSSNAMDGVSVNRAWTIGGRVD